MEILTDLNNPFNKFKLQIQEAVERGREESLHENTAKCKSQRAELFKELYSYYEKSYKQNTWTDYRRWLGRNKFKHSPQRIAEFKKSNDYRKKIAVKSFCSYWFSFLKTSDLYYLISVVKDKDSRGENVNKWLFWSIKNSVL
jgi:hypothetical protein